MEEIFTNDTKALAGIGLKALDSSELSVEGTLISVHAVLPYRQDQPNSLTAIINTCILMTTVQDFYQPFTQEDLKA